ncbi:MAG: hypothetical protein K2N80_09550 [Lachnospiraceae bacterium]|nr:hypothetical protein [Lachnospiraceae bacterium]
MNEKNLKKIETPTLTIKDNILKYKDSVIQLSNISKCEIAPEPPKSYPVWLFVSMIISALLMFNENFLGIGLFAEIIFVVIFYMILSSNANLKTYFILELNSGSIILFSSQNKDFLWEAQNAMINCFNNKKDVCVINFSDCTITHSQIGENNLMNNNEAQNGI